MQQKFFAVVLILLAISLTACGPAADPVQPTEPAATNTPAPTVEPIAEPAVAPTPEAAEGATPAPAEENISVSVEAGARAFAIAPDRSEVRFTIDEILRGAPKTVVGANNRVTGQIRVDPTATANTEIGAITIDAGGFVTGDNNRNNAIRRFILQTAQYPVVTFVPTQINALPESAAAGDNFDFQVTGDLTILNRANPVTFNLTATVLSEDEIQITGATTINRADFGISIPSVPFVANVGETLALELDLVVVAAE
ncbi:MAG: YceI family protein [Caldilineaceae bacterium]|nr:YceI family protein [Caldilineaceae bacterium]